MLVGHVYLTEFYVRFGTFRHKLKTSFVRFHCFFNLPFVAFYQTFYKIYFPIEWGGVEGEDSYLFIVSDIGFGCKNVGASQVRFQLNTAFIHLYSIVVVAGVSIA